MFIDGRKHDFKDEDGKHFVFKSVQNVISEIKPVEIFSYSSSFGINDFIPLIENYVFGDKLNNVCFKSFITSGIKDGFFRLLLNHSIENDTVIIPKPSWHGYERICKGLDRNCLFVPFFNNNQFNIDGIVLKISDVLKNQDSVVVVVNTPCHNPSGYSLSRNEFCSFIEEINKISVLPGKKIYLFLDVVYLDYEDDMLSRDLFLELCNLKNNVICFVQYSVSKSFLTYGMSVGLMTVIGNKSDGFENILVKEINFQDNLASNFSPFVQYVFSRILTVPDLYSQFRNDILYVRNILKRRYDYILKQSEIKFFPYSNGWKIFLLVENSLDVCKKLEKYGIFFNFNKLGICIPVSSLTLWEIEKVFYYLRIILKGEK